MVTKETIDEFSVAMNEHDFSMGNDLAGKVTNPEPYQIRTGTVDPGDTLSSITDEVNNYYGTEYDYGDMAAINKIENPDAINPGEIIQVGTVDENGNTWKPSYEEGVVDKEYWNELNEDQQKITHYHRNTFADEDIPKTKTELEKNEIKSWEEPKEAAAHNIGTKGNKDYRGKGNRANQQAIYDKNGNLVTTPENSGSYDYEKPSISNLYKYHLKVDVEPWLQYGNSPQDTTTKEERVGALSESWNGSLGLKSLGYKYNKENKKWIK